MNEICSKIDCNLDRFENSDNCILHCEKDSWYVIDNNGKKDWSNSKGKIQQFWELFKNELKKDEELHEFADIKFPISYIYDSFSEFELNNDAQTLKSLNLYNCTFIDKIEIKSTNFFNSLSFSDCTFKNILIIDGDFKNIDFISCSSNNYLKFVGLENANIYIEGSNFKDEIYSWLCSFKKFRVEITNIKYFKFFRCELFSKMVFNETNIDRLIYKKCKFDDGLYCEFHDVNISSFDIDSVDNISDAVVFFDVTIHRRFLLKNTNLSNYEFHTCNFEKIEEEIKIENVSFISNNGYTIFNGVKWGNISKTFDSSTDRDTFRQLKHVNEKQGNIIEANKFYSAEMKAYKEELKNNKNKFNRQDRFIFWLNEKVSNFSQSWLKPFGWFLLLGFIAFLLSNIHKISTYINNTSCISITTFWNALNLYFVYLNPFNTNAGNWNPIVWLIFKGLSVFIIYQFIISLRRQTRR